jgi:hypothetical protein
VAEADSVLAIVIELQLVADDEALAAVLEAM